MTQVRKQIVPVNRKWPLQSLIGTLRDLFPVNKAKSHARHVLIEYVMLRDVNDSLEDAHRYGSHACAVPCRAVLCCAVLCSALRHSAVLTIRVWKHCVLLEAAVHFYSVSCKLFPTACSASANNHGTFTHAA